MLLKTEQIEWQSALNTEFVVLNAKYKAVFKKCSEPAVASIRCVQPIALVLRKGV